MEYVTDVFLPNGSTPTVKCGNSFGRVGEVVVINEVRVNLSHERAGMCFTYHQLWDVSLSTAGEQCIRQDIVITTNG